MTGVIADAGKSPLMSRNQFQKDAVARRACAPGGLRLNHACHVHTVSLRSVCEYCISPGCVLSPARLASPLPSLPSYRSPASRDSFGVWDSACSFQPPTSLPPGLCLGSHLAFPFYLLGTCTSSGLSSDARPRPCFLQNLARTIYSSHLRGTFSFPFLCPLYLLLTSQKPSTFSPQQPCMKSYYVPVIGPGAKCTEVRKKL